MTEKQKRFNLYFWPIILGGLALVTVWWAYSEAPTHRHYNPANSNGTNHTYSDSTSISKLPPNETPNTKTTQQYSEKDREAYVAARSDLAAQWAMAHYTFVGIIAGLIGIGFIIWTLIEGRKAAYFTEQALNITKDTTYKELRAYIGIQVNAVPIEDGMESLAVDTTIHNHGQTPAYNIRLVYSLYNGMGQWGPEDHHTTAILNPNESFSPRLQSKFKNARVVQDQETIFFNFDIVFTDMNGTERWLKMNFSKPGKDWPKQGVQFNSARRRDSTLPMAKQVIIGTTQLYLVKMDTGDLKNHIPYKI